jgi:hypothetical protein
VCQLRPWVSSLSLNIAPRNSFTIVKSGVTNIWCFKQAVSLRKVAEVGFHSIDKFRAQIRNATCIADPGVFQADCHKENCRTVDCYSQKSEFESGTPRAWTARRVRIRPESGGWQSAVHLKTDWQAFFIVVANRGTGAWLLAI